MINDWIVDTNKDYDVKYWFYVDSVTWWSYLGYNDHFSILKIAFIKEITSVKWQYFLISRKYRWLCVIKSLKVSIFLVIANCCLVRWLSCAGSCFVFTPKLTSEPNHNMQVQNRSFVTIQVQVRVQSPIPKSKSKL